MAAIIPVATSRTSMRFNSASRYADRLPNAQSRIICVGGDRLQSPGPIGNVGFTTITGAPAIANPKAKRSASHFERQYGPMTSSIETCCFSLMEFDCRDRVRIDSVEQC